MISHFTGIDSDYEVPERPELTLNTSKTAVDALAETLLVELRRRHAI